MKLVKISLASIFLLSMTGCNQSMMEYSSQLTSERSPVDSSDNYREQKREEKSATRKDFEEVSKLAKLVEEVSKLESKDLERFKKLLKERKGKGTWEGTLARLFDPKGLRKSHQKVAKEIKELLEAELHKKRLSSEDSEKIQKLIEKIEKAQANVMKDDCKGAKPSPKPPKDSTPPETV